MNGLALCAGIGGLELGIRSVFPAARTVCYVEREAYCAEILAARGQAGDLDVAPIWDDLSTFDGAAWRGCVDFISAGFPCQPFSVAGKRQGLDDERWIWPAIERIIRDVGPSLVFLENVPGLVSAGLGPVLASLHSLGFNAEWGLLRASDVGAPHRRERCFVLGHTFKQRAVAFSPKSRSRNPVGKSIRPMGYTDLARLLADADSRGRMRVGEYIRSDRDTQRGDDADRCNRAFPPSPSDTEGWRDYLEAGGPEPAICRGADGTANRVHRLRALGNGVVPTQAAEAFRRLINRIREQPELFKNE